jgi:hypothetical protein
MRSRRSGLTDGAPVVTLSDMKTLADHNREMNEMYRKHYEEMARGKALGIACPECEGELWDLTPAWVNSSNPPSVWGTCDQCGHRAVVTI